MGKVSEILKSKGGTTFTITPDTFVYHALELMVEKNVSAMLITENDKLAGIFTERDYARKVILKGKASKETLISDVMTSNPITVSPEDTIDHCMRIMTDKHIRHLPVVDDEELVGIISIGDVVKFIIEEQTFIIHNLKNYISGA